VARDEIVREGSADRRPYYTTRQAANAANAASLSKTLESLCETCNGLGLNSAGPGLVRACTFCGGSGLQYWAKQKGLPGARFEGVREPFPFDLEAALR
jgi:DnaJ-class molecular chaperone